MNSENKVDDCITTAAASLQAMQHILTQQKLAYHRHPVPSSAERIRRLSHLHDILIKYQDDIAIAIHQDYGNRAFSETKIGEVLTCIEQINYYTKNIENWMKPEKRTINSLHQPAKGWIEYQPLGVIGIIAPWNYPLLLSIGPLICALAAGNHAMIKISSASANFGKLLEKILAEIFPQELVAVINGGGIISEQFSHLTFDKIVFTGSAQVGKTVMRAASENLVPVLLELGGKSPAIIHTDMSIQDAAQRIAMGKLWNAGQTCVAPDYLFLPKGKLQEFVEYFTYYVQKMYPTFRDNQDYTAIINNKQYQRLHSYLDDAKTQGASFTVINPHQENLTDVRKIAPTLVTNVTTDMQIMQNEIFGPLLPIIEYTQLNDALDFINQRSHPLALYYFDYNKDRSDYVLKHTTSGHFGNNQVLTHVAQDALPFGGIGASGMGKYHGSEGFFNMSHGRSVMVNSKFYSLKFILPPFNKTAHRLLLKMLLRK